MVLHESYPNRDTIDEEYKTVKFIPFNPTDKYTVAYRQDVKTGKVERIMKGAPQVGGRAGGRAGCCPLFFPPGCTRVGQGGAHHGGVTLFPLFLFFSPFCEAFVPFLLLGFNLVLCGCGEGVRNCEATIRVLVRVVRWLVPPRVSCHDASPLLLLWPAWARGKFSAPPLPLPAAMPCPDPAAPATPPWTWLCALVLQVVVRNAHNAADIQDEATKVRTPGG